MDRNKKKVRNNTFLGFTLIELLIAISIGSLLFVAGIAGYRQFADNQTLENVYKELNVNLNFAKRLATAGQKPDSCTGTLSGYNVSFASNSYTISAVCGNTITNKTITLPSGISISGGSSVLFKVLGQGTDLSSSRIITITQGYTGKTITATLTKEGVLQR